MTTYNPKTRRLERESYDTAESLIEQYGPQGAIDWAKHAFNQTNDRFWVRVLFAVCRQNRKGV